ncbi:hypothetical protein [Photobacterium leiognathi]|uniref:hypothetical protein n=1 Tax=Photobacterium leiognathi TaxID=553611 RepID=UPI0029820A29|nr:hypothetical protein [Photobacterium leiognathi]
MLDVKNNTTMIKAIVNQTDDLSAKLLLKMAPKLTELLSEHLTNSVLNHHDIDFCLLVSTSMELDAAAIYKVCKCQFEYQSTDGLLRPFINSIGMSYFGGLYSKCLDEILIEEHSSPRSFQAQQLSHFVH